MSNDVLGTRQAVWLVAKREILINIRAKSMWILTGITLFGIIAAILAFKFIGGDGAVKVGVVDESHARPLVAAAGSLNTDVETRTVDEAAGRRLVRDGELDVLVLGGPAAPKAVVERELDPAVEAALNAVGGQSVLDQEIRRAGGDPAAVMTAMSQVKVDVEKLDTEAAGFEQRVGISMIAGILVYLALIMYGQAVIQGVVEEKSSRVVELLLSTIRPWQLMFGKVLGLGVVGLAQFAIIAVLGAAVAVAADVYTIPSAVVLGAAGWTLLWFVVGYLMFALMFAAAGALVSRQEDSAGVSGPLMTLLIIPYVVGVSMVPNDPDSSTVVALSLIPFFSPSLMPMRMAFGAPAWQIALSFALCALVIAALVWLAGRIYRNSVLRTGTRVKLKEALRQA